MTSDAGDQTELVRRGYDALSYRYRADDAGEGGQFVAEGDGGHALFWAQRLAG